MKYRQGVEFLGLSFLAYLVIYGVYLFSSNNVPDKAFYLQTRRFVPCAMAVAAAVCLWLKAGLAGKKLLPHILLGLAWILPFNLFYWLTFQRTKNYIENYIDLVLGAYLIAVSICLRLLLLNVKDNPRWQYLQAVLMAMAHTILFSIPVFQLLYYFNYHTSFSVNAALAILQTNPVEAREYIMLNLSSWGIAVLGLAVFCFFYGSFKLNYLKVGSNLPVRLVLVTTVICLSTSYYCLRILPRTGIINNFIDASDYLAAATKFNDKHAKSYADLQVVVPNKHFQKPATIILVIGESATRSYMSAYNYKEYDTTPWMASMAANKNFWLFQHAYASAGQTVLSLERALTEKNQYNTKKFSDSLTIIDLAKKAGYTTYWFSSQGRIGGYETPITMVANLADHSTWLENENSKGKERIKYDTDLVTYLKQLDPKKNNFVVFHIIGSHEKYLNRYPPSFTKWGTPGRTEAVLNYANSLAYTDQFLKDVYSFAEKNLNLQVMLYFSDHGADPKHKRHPDLSGFIALRIPLFLYLSPEYQQLYPETTTALSSHLNTYFTNDLMYELVAGLLNLRSNHYDETNSLASPRYKYTREMLRTHIGKDKLSDDVDEK